MVELAMKRLGATGPAALTRRMEWDGLTAPKNISRWRREDHEMGFEALVGLLSEAGLLQPEAEAAWKEISLEAAQRRVAQARERAAAIDADRAPRVQQRGAAASPRRRAASGGRS